MKKYVFLMLAAFLVSGTALAYDESLAKTYEQFFAPFEEKQVVKALHLLPPDKVVEAIKKGEEIVLLDVRTKQEQSIVGLTYRNSLSMPMNEVFKPENLAKIPTDKRVIVTCKSGVRATVISLALQNIGFDNVYAMKGGLTALMKYLSPKTAF
ncbi:MAG: rhodanese-like domain-containing protein [Chromatiaceae bacterium]|nr:rhodanese-like domain-containing protein [Chromatiaceae bacterium]